MLLVEGLPHAGDALRGDLQILVQIPGDVDGKLIHLERIVGLHVGLNLLPILRDLVSLEELHCLLLQPVQQMVDRVEVEIVGSRVKASVVLRDDVGEDAADGAEAPAVRGIRSLSISRPSARAMACRPQAPSPATIA